MAAAPEDYSDGWQPFDSDDEEALQTLPPGEEGYWHSHAGREAVFHEIFDKCQPGRGDPRRRALHVQTAVNAWKEQIPYLVDAYLKLKSGSALNSDGLPGGWALEVIGLDEYGYQYFVHNSTARRTNETLILHGYIGASPEKPLLVFPLRLFEVYRQLHRVCPHFSLSALSTTLTNLHEFPRWSLHAEQLTTAYDAYLEIIREGDAHAHQAMMRDAAWYIQNRGVRNRPPSLILCSPTISILRPPSSVPVLQHGYNTFLTGHSRLDNHTSTSFRWLTAAQVDVFKDEVANSQRQAHKTKSTPDTPTTSAAVQVPSVPPSTQSHTPAADASPADDSQPSDSLEKDDDDGDVAWLNVNELSGSEADELTKCINTCVERIFLTVCRHGHVVVMCDMIRSGELMKYSLAMVKHLLDHYSADIGLGYDIMCAFFKTLMRSLLGATQVGWHPMYVQGVGLEDFEECERTFAKSNHLASSTRLCTPFHCQQQIDEHFYFHDLDKHAGSGNFIYQNYRQALEKIAINSGQLSRLESTLGTTATDYEAYHAAEVKYFDGLRKEPEEIQQTVNYIEKLQKYGEAVESSEAAKREFKCLDYNIVNNGYTGRQITLVQTRYRTTYTKLLALEEDLCRYEEEHHIVTRWTSDSIAYIEGLKLTMERKYRSALAEVERLVVQRLLELTKLGMSGLAYNLHEKISKALKTRSEAIHRALTTYNDVATALSPPRPRLTFTEVLQTTSLAEFDILRATREDIRHLPWTQPARREAMALHFGIKRAKEEIRRLNVEITRLLTFLIDEHIDYYKAIAANVVVDPSLAVELQRRWCHASHTSQLVGFSGRIFPGQRLGGDPNRGDGIPPPFWLASELGVTVMSVEYDEMDELPPVNVDDDEDLIVRELDVEEDGIVQLMDHLSTFDDS
ncbi:hypothetical protein C8R45DRAFT_1098732 [Mycena sanguinolenta]|nr:hypothetical protein C8R45DRAFT_1098732 [Mycena sanguinolenta]